MTDLRNNVQAKQLTETNKMKSPTHSSISKILSFLALSFFAASSLVAKTNPVDSEPWTFVSIPDFLNFDVEYPQKEWK